MEAVRPAYGHEELKKMHDHGFGRAVMGFRTTSDAIASKKRWDQLSYAEVRRLYPRETHHARAGAVEAIHALVALKIQQQGIGGLLDVFDGSASAIERALKAGLDAAGGSVSARGAAGSAVTSGALLVRDVMLDIYIFGTGPTKVPDFDHFMAYRAAKALEYELNRKLPGAASYSEGE